MAAGHFPVPLPCMATVSAASTDRFRPHFLAIAWDDMVDAWQLDAWEKDRALQPASMSSESDAREPADASPAPSGAGSKWISSWRMWQVAGTGALLAEIRGQR